MECHYIEVIICPFFHIKINMRINELPLIAYIYLQIQYINDFRNYLIYFSV
jgi:hypothetical protein